jgi:hypothetical protein
MSFEQQNDPRVRRRVARRAAKEPAFASMVTTVVDGRASDAEIDAFQEILKDMLDDENKKDHLRAFEEKKRALYNKMVEHGDAKKYSSMTAWFHDYEMGNTSGQPDKEITKMIQDHFGYDGEDDLDAENRLREAFNVYRDDTDENDAGLGTSSPDTPALRANASPEVDIESIDHGSLGPLRVHQVDDDDDETVQTSRHSATFFGKVVSKDKGKGKAKDPLASGFFDDSDTSDDDDDAYFSAQEDFMPTKKRFPID